MKKNKDYFKYFNNQNNKKPMTKQDQKNKNQPNQFSKQIKIKIVQNGKTMMKKKVSNRIMKLFRTMKKLKSNRTMIVFKMMMNKVRLMIKTVKMMINKVRLMMKTVKMKMKTVKMKMKKVKMMTMKKMKMMILIVMNLKGKEEKQIHLITKIFKSKLKILSYNKRKRKKK